MTPQERLDKLAKKAEASRARALNLEVQHSLKQARLNEMRTRENEKRERLFGQLLVLEAAKDDELWHILARLVNQIKQGPNASLLTEWKIPQLTLSITEENAEPKLDLSDVTDKLDDQS